MEKGEGQTDDSDTEHGGCTPAECPGNHNDGDTSSDGENMELAGTPTDNPQGTSEGAGSTAEDADVDDSDTEHGGCTPAECPGNHNDGDTSSDGENMELAGTPTDNPQGTSEGAGSTMEDADVDDSDTEHGGCTPAECPGNHNDGDTSSDGENMELAGTPTDNPQGTTEGAGSTAEDAEDKDVDEESADECLFDDITDEEEGAGIGDISQLGAGAVAVKFQTVQQESYQLVAKDTTALAHHIIGCCQQPEGEITSAPQQHQGKQLHPASAGDVDQTSQAQLPTTTPWVVPNTPSLQVPTTAAQIPVSTTAAQIPVSTTTPCVVPNTTSLQVPATAALTPASTSLLPRIPGSVVSEMQSSGLPEVPVTGDSRVVAQYNLIQVRQEFGDVTVPGARNVNIGGTQTIGEPQTIPEEEEKPLTAAQKIRNRSQQSSQGVDSTKCTHVGRITRKCNAGLDKQGNAYPKEGC